MLLLKALQYLLTGICISLLVIVIILMITVCGIPYLAFGLFTWLSDKVDNKIERREKEQEELKRQREEAKDAEVKT